MSVNQKLLKAIDFIRRINEPNIRTNHKGVKGRIGVVGGARDYAGAPYFASISAMRIGADLSYVICSRQASQAIKNYSPDLIVVPILDASDDEFLSEINCLMERLHALVIGPGLGRDKLLQSRAKLLIQLGKTRQLPLVLDADSLLLVNEDPSIIRSYPHAILTPNRVELQRMANILMTPKTYDLRQLHTSQIGELTKECSKALDVTILSKGPVDIIANPSACLKTDESIGSNRRCGGQGDILSGLAAVYLHWLNHSDLEIHDKTSIAGYLAATTTRISNELSHKQFENGMLASHMVENVYPALKNILSTEHLELHSSPSPRFSYAGSMNQDEIKRYTRQMIMEEFGPERQLKLKQASVLIIGAGGLGCPSSVYLAGAGIGRIGIVDHDTVEVSNLHRQILHSVEKIGILKTESIKHSLSRINPNVTIDTHSVKLSRHNAVNLIKNYDIVIDATDNLTSRYLISDACVVAGKPLISGAALKMDGQLTIYNYDEETPCFRCLFPVPPPSDSVGSCSENGVLGVIPGVIGVHQALEAIKLGSGIRPTYVGRMLLFDGQLGTFRNITLGKRSPDCEACGKNSKMDDKLIDYETFCGNQGCRDGKSQDILNSSERVTIQEYSRIVESGKPHILIDVRPLAQSSISRLTHALQIPVANLLKDDSVKMIERSLEETRSDHIYVMCRRGIASQRGAKIIQEMFAGRDIIVKDVIGGMTAWARDVDPTYSCL